MKLRKTETHICTTYAFKCPGCKQFHVFYTNYKDNPQWSWDFNNNLEKPTFKPSLRNRIDGLPPYCCHLFLTNGIIEYLFDCTHELKGQKVPLPDITDEENAVDDEKY